MTSLGPLWSAIPRPQLTRPRSIQSTAHKIATAFQQRHQSRVATQESPASTYQISTRPTSLIESSRFLASSHLQHQQPRRRQSRDSNYFQRWAPAVGSEPGFDPAVRDPNEKSDHLSPKSQVEVQIVDYSQDRLIVHKPAGASLEQFLNDNPKPEWASCRWIWVNGIEPEVVRCLGTHKDLHPLALEDVLDMQTPTKVNWYENHCYLEMNMVKLTEPFHGAKSASRGEMPGSLMRTRLHSSNGPRSSAPSPVYDNLPLSDVAAIENPSDLIVSYQHRDWMKSQN